MRNILKRFDGLHNELDVLGGDGTEGYQLLPAAGAAFFQAGLKDARLSLREPIRAATAESREKQFEQIEAEKQLPARIGIKLRQDLQPESGRTLALAAVYECNPNPVRAWKISDEDEWGHWVALVGKERVPKTRRAALDEFNGIVLDSNRRYERWKVDDSGLQLKRAPNPSKASGHIGDIKVWVYSLITIEIVQSS